MCSSDLVVFHSLKKAQIRRIADIQLARLAERLSERELTLELADNFVDALVEQGYDPVYGARPLKRAVQRMLENPLAQEILAGRFEPGQRLVADLEGDKTVFNIKPLISTQKD